jgi:hypothetical protein
MTVEAVEIVENLTIPITKAQSGDAMRTEDAELIEDYHKIMN